MRKYQSIWKQIKTTGECIVAAHPSLHKRIKKAVCKEKYKDIAFKVEWDLAGAPELPELAISEVTDNPNAIKFILIKPVLLRDL